MSGMAKTTNSLGPRYLLLRVPNSGPKALAGPPNDFASFDEADARLREISDAQTKSHHTYLEITEYAGDKIAFLEREGILY